MSQITSSVSVSGAPLPSSLSSLSPSSSPPRKFTLKDLYSPKLTTTITKMTTASAVYPSIASVIKATAETQTHQIQQHQQQYQQQQSQSQSQLAHFKYSQPHNYHTNNSSSSSSGGSSSGGSYYKQAQSCEHRPQSPSMSPESCATLSGNRYGQPQACPKCLKPASFKLYPESYFGTSVDVRCCESCGYSTQC
ncbi:hypothetical protein GQ42DRAFT_9093 [Ramicandelaber brevisporus]|nr:hypothetical protein GQ42DRAFT_9093 [Ramicandelaber brevisporus]